MKNDKGITLISVTIYVIAMLVTITVLSVMSNFFYNNIIAQRGIAKTSGQLSKFNMYFIEDAKASKGASASDTQLAFSNGSVYTFSKAADADVGIIYRDKAKVCEDVAECSFTNIDTGDLSKVNVQITFQGGAATETLSQTYQIGRGY